MWHDSEDNRQRSFETTPEKSRLVPELCLVDRENKPIHRYGFYVGLRTSTAWQVLVITWQAAFAP